jgi:ppGpp synthetase/RelA/SpoT-type nucleotidyltranferase
MTRSAFSKSLIDRLGERFKKGHHTQDDLRLLDDYRRSFGEAYEAVVGRIRAQEAHPTGRRAKSTLSIVEKLRRETIRLSQMQDIAGCRVIVADIVRQDEFVEGLKGGFDRAVVLDRREKPSHGYRAVHVVVEMSDRLVEVQVRSTLQHDWAELSEKASDVVGPAIKYGGGDERWRRLLSLGSKAVAAYEEFEQEHSSAAAAHVAAQEARATLKIAGTVEPELKTLETTLESWALRLGEVAQDRTRLRKQIADELAHLNALLDGRGEVQR